MAYYLDIFSPETYETFTASDRSVSGYRIRQLNTAQKIHPGDKFLCYMTKLGRWVGILEIASECFVDQDHPLFYEDSDPFVVRFRVKPLVWLPKEKAVPIREDEIWNAFSFTKGHQKHSSTWTGKFRGSLTPVPAPDGELLEGILRRQVEAGRTYPVDESEYRKFLKQRVRAGDKKVVTVSIPEEAEADKSEPADEVEARQSIKYQALLAMIGEKMGFRIWLPRNDRSRVLREWKPENDSLLDELPLSYDAATIKTIEQIDVLWLRRRSIVRAFEVEHTTSVYSGILRMADLLALQPNMDIRLHIVAPASRKDKVFQELLRPVFSLLEKGPLAESCTFISYDSLDELAKLKHLHHLSDSVLEEYGEEAE